MKRHPMFGLFLALFGGLAITPDTLFMRWSQMGGLEMQAWRGLLMGAMLIGVWSVFSRRSRRADLLTLVSGDGLMVVFCQFISASLFSLGIAQAPVAVVLFSLASVPVFSAIFAFLLLGEETHWSTWGAIVAVMIGIGLAVFGNGPGTQLDTGSPLLGAAAGLGVAMALALNFISIRRNPRVSILLSAGSGAALAGAAGLAAVGPIAMQQGHIWAIAVTGLAVLPVSFFSLASASRHTMTTNVSLFMLVETVLGPFWVWAGTGERPTDAMMTGGAFVVGSLVLYLWYAGRRQARAREPAAAAQPR
ncbi:MAG: DMT family transporter [Acidihalobacter sp.]